MFSEPSSAVAPSKQFAATGTSTGRGWHRFIAMLLILSGVLTFGYTTLSVYIAAQLIYAPQEPLYSTPAALGLKYQNVTFPSREDHLQLQGWFIPGILPNGSLTAQRTIIVVHGNRTNRADKDAGILLFSVALARHGFAVLAFDMRGTGESPPAPLSLGYFEQRDVLGAVDFLRSGPLPYPKLGRPRVMAGWGVSMGGATLIFAAAREQAIRAVVSDSAYADIIPILEREVPKGSHLPSMFTPGTLWAARALYGIDFYAVRPVDVIANIAPRPLLLIHGSADVYIPPSNVEALTVAARTAPGANVQTWLVPGAGHAQSFNLLGTQYVARVVTFYTAALGADTGAVSSRHEDGNAS